ncbi:MAG: HEPN domain-containing protein [Muribaculaceae bacterium]|nr:HEPN domain-containing protein [Muribaculaceae bacterium]
MKETLYNINRKNLIEYRLKRADETLEEAEYNARGMYYNAAVNRLYYACFYAAAALMLKYNLDTSTHKGVRNQLGLQFITAGKLEPRYGSIYSRLYQARQAGDYEDFVYCDENMYNEYKPLANDFITAMKELINSVKD